MNKIVQRIEHQRTKRGWTVYKLGQESDVPAATIRRWIQIDDMYPSIPVLTQICDALGITLAELFLDGEIVEFNDERKELIENWGRLTKEERAIVQSVMNGFLAKKN